MLTEFLRQSAYNYVVSVMYFDRGRLGYTFKYSLIDYILNEDIRKTPVFSMLHLHFSLVAEFKRVKAACVDRDTLSELETFGDNFNRIYIEFLLKALTDALYDEIDWRVNETEKLKSIEPLLIGERRERTRYRIISNRSVIYKLRVAINNLNVSLGNLRKVA